NRTRESRPQSAQDDSEHVRRQDYIELRGGEHELHRGVVHVKMFELNGRMIRSEPPNRLTPKLGHRQHVGLVHGSNAALPRFSARESVLGDALDLASRI